MYDVLYQIHIGTWAILFLSIVGNLFFRSTYVTVLFRILAVLMLVSGIALTVLLSFPLVFVIKLFIALFFIAFTEKLMKSKQPSKQYVLISVTGLTFILLVLIGFGVIRF
ncbi:DUF1516 family protein [Shouchella sp. 1P09AA]|uniref:DUF1516 family protein n=1 Tax=unclassified Shouchella TaxID=2893065 RepID=UPI0039A2BC7D